MFRPLRALRERVEADDVRMRADGFEVLATGRFSRTYRLHPDEVARRQREADDERVRQMAQRSRELYAVAFPEQHAAQVAREAAGPLPLDQFAAALALRAERVVFERLTIDNRPQVER